MFFSMKLCCICQVSSGELVDISTTTDGECTLLEKLKHCVPEISTLTSPSTTLMCHPCCDKLHIVYNFKVSCIKTHEILNEYATQLALNGENSISQLTINIDKQIKHESLADTAENEQEHEELYTVYRVEVIKELDESQEDYVEQDAVDYLKQDLTTMVTEMSTISSPENPYLDHFESNLICEQDDEDFVGFSSIEIQSSELICDEIIGKVNRLGNVKSERFSSRRKRYTRRMQFHFDESSKQVLEISNEIPGPCFCLICMQKINSKKNLKKHLVKHLNVPKDLSCSFCNKRFNNSGKLYYHKMVHHQKSTHVCDICDRTFTTNARLVDHISKHTSDDLYSCRICQKKLSNKASLKRHLVTHNQANRPYKCPKCPKAFTLRQYVMQHVKSHEPVKPFQCTICNKRFTRKQNLAEHLAFHKRKKIHKCAVCHMTFDKYIQLKNHYPQCKALPFGCAICKKDFKHEAQLNYHIMQHLP